MLTELACRNFKAKDRDYKKFDSGGLFLLIKTNGRKYWHLKYRIAGREKLLALGVYPEISLSEARSKRSMYREKIKEGIDPIQEKRQVRSTLKQKQGNTFEKVALEWLEKWSHGRERREASIRLSRLKRHIFSYLGNIPIRDITTEDLISVIKRIEDKGPLFLKKDIIEWMQKKAATDQMFIYRLNSDFTEDYTQLHPTKISENEKVSKEDFFKLLAKEILEDIAP